MELERISITISYDLWKLREFRLLLVTRCATRSSGGSSSDTTTPPTTSANAPPNAFSEGASGKEKGAKERGRILLEATVAPAVANLEVGVEGFQIDEVMRLIRCVRGLNVIGGDVVCLMPTKDSPNKQTSHVASVIMFEIVSLVADRLKR